MKKLIPLSLGLILAMAVPAYADNITVTLNGSPITMENAPVIEQNRTLVPFRSVLEAMGAEVSWDANTKTVTCVLEDNRVSIQIGADNMYANDEAIPLDVAAKVIDGRTYVPLRAISEGLGAQVDWDSDTKTVSIGLEQVQEPVAPQEDTDSQQTKDSYSYTMATLSNPITSGTTQIMAVEGYYPVFAGSGRGANRINNYIYNDVQTRVNAYKMANKQELNDYYQATVRRGNASAFGDYSYTLDYDVRNNTDGIISIYVTETIASINTNKTNVFCINLNGDTAQELSADDIYAGAEATAKAGYKDMGYSDVEISNADFGDNSFYVEDGKLIYVVYIGTANKAYVEYEISLPVVEEEVSTDVSVSTVSISDQLTSQDDNIVMRLNGEYPAFSGENDNLPALNEYVANVVSTAMEEYSEATRSDVLSAYKTFKDDINNKDERFTPWLWTMDYEVVYNDGKHASLIVSTYTTNEEEQATVYEAFVLDLTTGQVVDVDSLIQDKATTDALATEAFHEMIDSNRLKFYTDVYDRFSLDKAIKYISKDGVTYMFNPGELASVSKGIIQVTVPLG